VSATSPLGPLGPLGALLALSALSGLSRGQEPPAPAPADVPRPASTTSAAVVQDPRPVASPEAPDAGARVQAPDAGARPALVWDGKAPGDAAAFAALLEQFAQAWPESFRSTLLAGEAGADALWLLTLSRAPRERWDSLPAVLVAPTSESGGDAASAARLLQQCAVLLEASAGEGPLAGLAQHSVVHVVPWLRPAQAFAPRAVAPPDYEFPAGFAPGGEAGALPLASPAARALAQALLARPRIALCAWSGVEFAPPGGTGAAGSEGPAAFQPRGRPGSLQNFARDYLGTGVRLQRAPAGLELEARRQAEGEWAALLGALPRLTVELERAERLRPELWSFEVRITNQGQVATLQGAAALREPRAGWLTLEGAELVAAGAAEKDGAEHAALDVRGGRLALAHFAPGAVRRLRLVVRGQEAAAARVVLQGLRFESSALPLELR